MSEIAILMTYMRTKKIRMYFSRVSRLSEALSSRIIFNFF
jgi:hypothetical protein